MSRAQSDQDHKLQLQVLTKEKGYKTRNAGPVCFLSLIIHLHLKVGKILKMQVIMKSINDARQDFLVTSFVSWEPALLNLGPCSHM